MNGCLGRSRFFLAKARVVLPEPHVGPVKAALKHSLFEMNEEGYVFSHNGGTQSEHSFK